MVRLRAQVFSAPPTPPSRASLSSFHRRAAQSFHSLCSRTGLACSKGVCKLIRAQQVIIIMANVVITVLSFAFNRFFDSFQSFMLITQNYSVRVNFTLLYMCSSGKHVFFKVQAGLLSWDASCDIAPLTCLQILVAFSQCVIGLQHTKIPLPKSSYGVMHIP